MKVKIHRANIYHMMSSGGSIGRAAARAAGKTRDRAKENVSVDTGTLRNSITSELVPSAPMTIHWKIGTNLAYGLYQEIGVDPIYARHAPLLVFKVAGKWVSVYSTSGVPAQRYLTNAINSLTSADFRGGQVE